MDGLVKELREREEAKKASYGFLDVFACAYENPDISDMVNALTEKGKSEEELALEKKEIEANESRKFWHNYDMSQSLDPNLIDPKTYRAANGIASAWRVQLAKKAARLMKFKVDKEIIRRMATTIACAWRRYMCQRRYTVLRDAEQANLRRLNEYRKFRRTLLGKGYKAHRWSHSQRKLIPCVIRVDWSIEHIVFEQNILQRKLYDVQDINSIKLGYASEFLKSHVYPTNPEKTLSLFIRDRRKSNAPIVSVDLQFDDIYLNKSLEVQEGRIRCSHFLNGVRRLIRELDGDDSCYFNEAGAYCRVRKSVFERWERITLINPKFDPTKTDLEARLQARDFEALRSPRGSKRKTLRGPEHHGMYAPFPLSQSKKPQNQTPRRLVFESNTSNLLFASTHHTNGNTMISKDASYAATWWSETTEIKYGKNATKVKHSDYFQEPMRKEIFYLQRCVKNEQGDFEPQFHLRQPGRPVLAPLRELKPYFQAKLQELYGYTGIAGWRSTDNGQIELDDHSWRMLCKIAFRQVGTREAIKYAKALLEEIGYEDEEDYNLYNQNENNQLDQAAALFNNQQEEEARTSELLLPDTTTTHQDESRVESQEKNTTSPTSPDASAASPRISAASSTSIFQPPPANQTKKKIANEELQRRRRLSLLQHLQKRLLIAMYQPQARVEGRMWQASRITYNQAQKKRYIEERKKQEIAAMREYTKRQALIAEKERNTRQRAFQARKENEYHQDYDDAQSIRSDATDLTPNIRPSSLYTTKSGSAASSESSSSPPNSSRHLIQQQPQQRALNASDRGCMFNIVVLVQSYFHKVPLGLYGIYLDISDAPIRYQARRRSPLYECGHILCIQGLEPEAAPSLVYGWQNNILCKGDMLVAVDDRIPRNHNELLACCQIYHKPRDLSFYRPDPKFLDALAKVRFDQGKHLSV